MSGDLRGSIAAPRDLPLVQFNAAPGTIDLGWGQPDPELLPVDELRRAAEEAARRWGPDLYSYGFAQGPAPLITWLAQRLGDVDGRAPDPDSIVVTAGASGALDMAVTLAAKPGDVALVESPTYHIAVKLLRDHGLEVMAIERGADGPDLGALASALDRLRRAGRRAALFYTIPTFHNPTGALTPLDRRNELVQLAEERNLLVIEDDAYRELWYDDPPPPSVWSLAKPGTVIRVGSFSKTLAPGLRLGFLTGDAALTKRFVQSGLLDSGGGVGHIPGLTVAILAENGFYARHVERLRVAYQERRDALVDGLIEGVPGEIEVNRPQGGFFVWLTLPGGSSATHLLEIARDNGVSFVSGTAFTVTDAGDANVRLSFSRYDPEDLEEAARRIGASFRLARGT